MNHDDCSKYEQRNSMNNNDEKNNHRYSNHQTQQLEAYFKNSPSPNNLQEIILAEELGLQPEQIKFWFRNKRTNTKVQNERGDNKTLKTENEQLKMENEAMEAALKTVVCPSCGGPPIGNEERHLNLQKLRLENVFLIKEYERLSSGHPPHQGGHSVPTIDALAYHRDPPTHASASHNSPHVSDASPSNQFSEPQSFLSRIFTRDVNQPPQLPTFPPLSEMEKMVVNEKVKKATAEVVALLRIQEPLWVKSPVDGGLVIDQEVYGKLFTNTRHLESPSCRIESSKEVVKVQMDVRKLIEAYLDTEKWARLFPTIVNDARTIHEMEPDGQNYLKLMYEQLHILSPLVPPREFMILRSCQQVEENLWLVIDVSYDLPYGNFKIGTPTCHKRPSGCLLKGLPYGQTEVTWMEHVEVDDIRQTHCLYRDLLCSGFGYGARRWTVTLQRMSERLSLASNYDFPCTDSHGVVLNSAGRGITMKLGEKMLKDFALILKMSKKVDFSQQPAAGSEVRHSIRRNLDPSLPSGLIFCAISSLCLPIPPHQVYTFLNDLDVRPQWDVLCHGNRVIEVARFATRTDHKNCVTILQPLIPPKEGSGGHRIIQDCFIDALGGMVVYSLMDFKTAYYAISGQDIPSNFNFPVIPSGFIISPDVRDISKTLLTVAFQVFVSGPKCVEDQSMQEYRALVDRLVSKTVQRIKAILNCNDAQ